MPAARAEVLKVAASALRLAGPSVIAVPLIVSANVTLPVAIVALVSVAVRVPLP
jgi:hypothetical protein